MDAKAELMKAEWIWPEPYHLLRNTYAQFRADFILAARPRRAPLAVSADQMYMLYINGVYVMRGPARGYQASWPFDEIDVAAWLKPGKNWISIRAYNAGVSTFQYLHQRAAGVICALRVGSTTLRTGQGWWMRVDPACRRDTGRLSMQLNFQEWVDARLDDEDWLYASRFSRQGWIQVRHGKPFGSMPWHDMEPRGIPNLSATVVPYRSLRARSHGRSLHDGQHGFAIHEELHCLEWQPIAGGRATGDRFRFVISPAAKGAFLHRGPRSERVACGGQAVLALSRLGGPSADRHAGAAQSLVSVHVAEAGGAGARLPCIRRFAPAWADASQAPKTCPVGVL